MLFLDGLVLPGPTGQKGCRRTVLSFYTNGPASNPNNQTRKRVVLHALGQSKLFYIPPRDTLGLGKLLENSKADP